MVLVPLRINLCLSEYDDIAEIETARSQQKKNGWIYYIKLWPRSHLNHKLLFSNRCVTTGFSFPSHLRLPPPSVPPSLCILIGCVFISMTIPGFFSKQFYLGTRVCVCGWVCVKRMCVRRGCALFLVNVIFLIFLVHNNVLFIFTFIFIFFALLWYFSSHFLGNFFLFFLCKCQIFTSNPNFTG